jgi:hypothetical protein
MDFLSSLNDWRHFDFLLKRTQSPMTSPSNKRSVPFARCKACRESSSRKNTIFSPVAFLFSKVASTVSARWNREFAYSFPNGVYS